MRLEISKETNNILRGVAILGIVIHNFCGWQGNAVCENEFSFSASNITDLIQSVRADLLGGLWDILAFFGHYGVEVFVFLSGYGLAKKHKDSIPAFGDFIRHNIGKLWLLMIPGLVCYGVLTIVMSHDIGYTIHQSLFTFTFASHFTGSLFSNIAYGPYWYFGVTLQLYIFYYALLHRHGNMTLLFWSAIVLVTQIVVIAVSGSESQLLEQLRANIFIAVPTFCLGIWLARNPIELNPRRWQFYGLMLFVVTIILSTYPHPAAWLLSSPIWPLALVWICTLLPRPLKVLMLNIGILSPWIFVAHPVARQIAYRYIPPTEEYTRWLYLAIYLALTAVLALAMSRLINAIRGRYKRQSARRQQRRANQ